MAAYTPSLRLTLPVTGTDDGTWGDTVNNGITSLTDAAIAGTATVIQGDVANYTLTNNSGATDQARNMFLNITGALTAARNVVCPTASKLYFIKNSTTGGFAVTLKTAAGTGISVPAGSITALYCDGTNVVDAITYANIPVINATTVDTTNLEVTNIKAKDGAASITLANTTGVATITAAPVLTVLTASQAVFTNASKALVSNAITGTGNVVMSASPTLTGTISAAAANFSGAVALGDAAADTVTVNGTVTSNLIFTDNTYDIGATGATRPRNLFLAGNATVGGNIVLTGSLDLTDLEVTNIKAKDGTASITLADTTGIATFSKATIISTSDATNAALRVTQTGAGNAFIVEDIANPDASPFVIDAAGVVLAGFTTAPAGSYKAYISGTAFATGAWRVGDNTDGSTSGYFSNTSNTTKSIQIAADPDNLGASSIIALNIDGAEKARFDSSGRFFLGSASASAAGIKNSWNLTGGTTAYGDLVNGTIQSDVTGNANLVTTIVTTAAAVFNITNLRHFYATSSAFGAGSTVTNQYGFVANSDLTAATNNYGFYSAIPAATGAWNFYAAGTATNYFAGSVGIGTTAPLTTLNVNGTGGELLRISVTSNSGVQQEPALGFATGVTNVYPAAMISALEFDASDSRASMLFYTRGVNTDSAPTERMRIDSAGNLGLGVTPSSAWNSSAKTLDMPGGSVFTLSTTELNLGQNAYFNVSGNFIYKDSSAASRLEQVAGAFNWYNAPSGTAGNVITFTQAMTLDASGNLSIGTSTSQGKLTVQGDVYTRSGGVYYVQNADNTNNYYLQNSGATGASKGNLNFVQGGVAVRATLDSAGNLGLGVTPSAWAGYGPGQKVLQLQSFAISSDVNTSYHTNNATFTSGSNWFYNASKFALKVEYDSAVGAFRWYNAPSGTAGNAIAFTQAMTLDASGNLLVGTTSTPGAGSATTGAFLGASGVLIASRNTASGAAAYITVSGASGDLIQFFKSTTFVGSITTTGSATAYNTSSDYRLKNITGPITTSGAYIDSLKPVEGTWKADGSTFVGLIAHETQEVSRTTVATGTKDGEQMQGMDYSSAEIIANLIAEIQDLRKRLAAAGI